MYIVFFLFIRALRSTFHDHKNLNLPYVMLRQNYALLLQHISHSASLYSVITQYLLGSEHNIPQEVLLLSAIPFLLLVYYFPPGANFYFIFLFLSTMIAYDICLDIFTTTKLIFR
jgi:hypothetical protein